VRPLKYNALMCALKMMWKSLLDIELGNKRMQESKLPHVDGCTCL
jgi:hypothetical protein